MYTLVVTDDEFEIRNNICSLFPWNSIGFQVVQQCSSGNETIQCLEKDPPDVLLTDICLPDLSGIEIAKYVYEHSIPTIVVFLSGYQEFSFARGALKYKVFDYILKPTDYESIQTVFEKVKAELDSNKGNSESSVPMSYPEKVIEQSKKYIRAHLADVTYISAALNVGFNPSYFSTYFKEYTGQNFSDYVLQVKMERARQLLADVSLSSSDIAEMLGYSNVSNFARVFKSYYHMTPTEYRKGKNL
ncbi:MAG TPA: helix-turn-helix domain-containing protein [Candidatus Mediterraneibacter norfolkensis]|nr:helix-turn-helix domain-containing protein [Candidatus Mediterraneibacter norfolkensis]